MTVAAKHRDILLSEIKKAHNWLDNLQAGLLDKRDDVIPWIVVQSILETANAIAYESGMVNGAILRGNE